MAEVAVAEVAVADFAVVEPEPDVVEAGRRSNRCVFGRALKPFAISKVIPWGLDHERFRTGRTSEPFYLPGTPLAAQEPRQLLQAFALLRRGAARAPSSCSPAGATRADVAPPVSGARPRLGGRAPHRCTAAPPASSSRNSCEGCVTAAQAMASGCPVAASNIRPWRACGGGGALQRTAPRTSAGCRRRRPSTRRSSSTYAGLERARGFTWEETAQRQHEDVYRSLG